MNELLFKHRPVAPFLAGGGKMGALIRAHDWGATPFGLPAEWPTVLLSMVSASINSPLLTTVLWGQDLRMIYNDTYAESLADRHPAALGRTVSEVWGAAWEQVSPPFLRALTLGEGFAQENVRLEFKRNGQSEVTWWDITATPIRGEDGSIVGLLNQGIDTTRQVWALKRAAHEQQRQQRLLDQMPGFVAVLAGPEHVFEYVNAAYIAISGSRQFVGRSVRQVFPELAIQGFYELLDQVYASGERYRASAMPIQLQVHQVDHERFIDFLYEPMRDERGAVTGIFVGGYDVTDAVRTNVALKKNEDELRTLADTLEQRVSERTAERDRIWYHSHDIFTVIDMQGILQQINPAVTRLLGWTPEEMIGRPVMEFIHADTQPPLQNGAFIEEHYAKPAIFYNRFRHKDGSYRSLSWLSAFDSGFIYSSGRDITLEKQQAEALKESEERLRQSQKMEAVGQLTGGLAHDFNNLLTGITGSLELMQSRIAQGRGAEADRYIGAARGAAQRAASLTHRLLAFSRRQTLDPKPVNVNRLIGGMEELIQRTVGPHVSLEVVAAVGLWPTLVDFNQLENALLNLCLNARDAMPNGGRITIETANKWLDEQMSAERDLPAGHYLALSVTDTGTGMTSEVKARAFEPFFTTKPIGMGTGLGLSMIYGFARQSGGQLQIYSELGLGTTIALYLPRYMGDAQDADPLSVSIETERAVAGETVLVIDDEPTVRMLITDVLQESGYTALEAQDGQSGLRVLQSRARIDLLITDVGLPGGINGRQVADAARLLRPNLKVLFITGYAENAVVGNGHVDRRMAILTKPFAMDALVSKVRDVMAGE